MKTKNKNNPAEDPLGICNRMLSYCMQNSVMLDNLLNLFNSCIRSQTFPEAWKVAKIVPIPKQNNATSSDKHRPIAILPSPAKLFEKCLYGQMICYSHNRNLISSSQFGFRPRHSTVHAMLRISELIYSNMNAQKITVVVSIHIKKCFDTVNREILVQKLRKCGFVDNLFVSYFKN